jgi:hypothetical protein
METRKTLKLFKNLLVRFNRNLKKLGLEHFLWEKIQENS